MAGPEDWGAQPADDPTQWGAQAAPETREGGIIQTVPKAFNLLGSPEGRSKLLSGVEKFPGEFVNGLIDFFKAPGTAVKQGLTPEQETEFGLNAALGTIGGGEFRVPKEAVTAVAPIVKQFDDTVMKPAAQRITAPLDPTRVTPVEGANIPAGVSRSELATTGEPHIDAVLNSAVTKNAVDNPIVDRTHDIPYTAGGSVPLEDPKFFIDKHFPESFTVDGVTFDPADPFVIHENIEQHVMDLLIKNGMDDEAAYRVAHFEYAEKAEGAWYKAHGIDQEKAEAAYKPYMDQIQRTPFPDVPDNLYKRPYPHDQPSAAAHESLAEPKPSPAEIAQAKDIITKMQQTDELQPGTLPAAAPKPNPLQQAREFGVIGPERVPIDEPPAQAAARAVPAARTGDDKITMTPAGEPIDAWQARFKEWVSRIKEPDEVKPFIEESAAKNNNFPEARAGEINPAHIEVLADAAGIDPTKLDRGKLTQFFNTPDKIRMAKQLLDQTLSDFRDAAAKVETDPSDANISAMLAAEIRRDYALEQTLGLRAEWGRAGHALRDLLEKVEGQDKLSDLLKSKGRTPEDMQEIARGMRGLDNDQAARALSEMRGKAPHWFFWGWQQGLISGVITHSKYLGVNTGFTYLERVIAPALAAVLGKLRSTPDKVFLGEPLVAHWGFIRAVPDAFRASGEAFRSNMRVPLASELELGARGEGAEVPYGRPNAPNWGIWQRVFNNEQLDKATAILGVPGKSANAIHTFYKVLSQGASAESRAYNMAAKEGLSPLTQDFWERYSYHRANPTEANLRGAVDDAYSGAFMEKLGDRTGKWAATARNNPILKWLFPFQHIPLNIERQTIRYSPAAFAGPEMRAALFGEKGGAAQDLAIAKVVIGSATIAYFANKYLMGQGTGDYPTDPKERRDWALQGKIPNAIQSGEQWIQLERFGPPGNVAKIGLNIGSIIQHYDGQDDEALMKLVGHAALAAANQIGNEVGFQTVRNIIDALEEPRKLPRFAAWQIGSFIPYSSFMTQNASILDPDMRIANTLKDGIKYRIPFLRETLLPKRDPLYGEPVVNPGYGSVVRMAPINTDPVKQELERLDLHPTAPKPNIGGVKLTPEQYDRYEATAGPLVKQALSAIVQQPGWANLPAEARKRTMTATISAMRQRAAATMQIDQPDLVRQGIERRIGHIAGQP